MLSPILAIVNGGLGKLDGSGSQKPKSGLDVPSHCNPFQAIAHGLEGGFFRMRERARLQSTVVVHLRF